MKSKTLLLFLSALWLAAAAFAAGPPCRPCAGVRVADPTSILAALGEAPRVEDEARLYVAWPADLDGSADPALFQTLLDAGATPWMVVRFRTPAPVRQNLDQLETELRDLARLARGASDRAHFQIVWDAGMDGGAPPSDLAFLLKRAAVVVTGARSDARFLVGPLAADPGLLRALYAEEVAAYVDGVALAPGGGVAASIELLRELDPGKPVAVDAYPWPDDPARTLARAAEDAANGVGVTFFDLKDPAGADLAPLKVLARELQGDLSYDVYSRPSGSERSWAFVRGDDLSLRVIAEAPPSGGLELLFEDPQLRSPSAIDLTTGDEETVFDQRRTASGGLLVPFAEPGRVVLVRLERMTAAELEGVEERLDVEDTRQMPVEEILRRLQAFEDDQARKLHHFEAQNTLHLRFLVGAGAASIEAAYEGPFFFERDQGFDWVWETFYVDGVKWRGKRIPEIPLIQPEKAAALPLEIHLLKEYRYRLRGTATVDGRDCWVVDFEPVEITPGRNLHQGTVWVDREVYARVRTRAVQLALEGEVISNEETMSFTPLDAAGQPAPWSRESFIVPTRVVGQQLLSILNATVPVETESELVSVRINGEEFAANRDAARASESTMVRDTEKGLRYLVKDEEGQRIVQEEVDTTRLFLVGGVFWDESVDFPIPLVGVNYLALDWRGTGNQLNLFFAGPLLTLNLAEPRLFGSRWDAGINAFGFFINTGDEIFRDGREVPEEEIENLGGSLSVFVGRPLGNFTKLDFTYRLGFDKWSTADTTAEGFVLPEDTLTHTFRTELAYNRAGWRLSLRGSFNSRADWEPWGLPVENPDDPSNPIFPEFDPEQKDYVRWQATFAKTFWLKRFMKFGVELEHLDGSDLDRFSRYDFGIFGDSSVGGYPSGLVRADEADGIHLEYGINIADLFRIELEGDAVWATNEETGLDRELLAGIGFEGSLTLPWQLLVNFEIGQALDGPADSIAARIIFLRLFSGKRK